MKILRDYSTDEEILVFDVGSLYARLQKMKDLRRRRGKRYPLAMILTMILLAKLAGEDEPRGIAGWLKNRAALLCRLLNFTRGTTPHHTTISRVLGGAVEAEELDEVIGAFLLDIQLASANGADAGEKVWVVISFDGKTLRGTIALGETQGYHLLAAYLPGRGVVLMQLAVDRKENEITVAPRLLEMIDVRGKVVTSDALNTQREFARQIVDAGGDYLFIVKDNQPNTRAAIEDLFTEPAMRPGFHAVPTDFQRVEQPEKSHGRLETRTLTTSSMLNDYLDWPYLGQVFQLQRRVVELSTGKTRQETVYGITSLSATKAAPHDLLHINRTYWGIENGLHYRRDVTFKEDDSRLFSHRAQHVMASLNNLVLGLILKQKPKKATVPDERRRYCAQPVEALRLLTRLT